MKSFDKRNNATVKETCFELYRSEKIIQFIGAGFSTRFGMPTWDDLIKIIASQLKWDPDIFKINGNYLQLAGYYVAVTGSIGPLRSLLDRKFNPSDDAVKASRAHMALTKFRTPVIYTTNFDDLIERSFELNNTKHQRVSNIGDMLHNNKDHTEIVKFHGTFDDDKSIVFTEENYFERLEFESALDINLRCDSLYKTLLFIGYGFDDLNIRYMLYKLKKLRKQFDEPSNVPIAIMTTFSSKEVQQVLNSKWNVLTYPLDPLDKDASIDKFMESFL